MKYSEKNPAQNLALEHSIIQSKIPTIRIWKNPKTVVLGRTQDLYREINVEYCMQHNIEINRRISSGGTVYHDMGNLNISFFLPLKKLSREVMTAVSKLTLILHDALLDSGLKYIAIHNSSNLTYKGSKISGSAQYYYSGFLLHHATLLISADLRHLENSLLVKEMEPLFRNSSRYYPTTNLIDFEYKEFEAALITIISDYFREESVYKKPSENEISRMKELVENVYTKDHWIYHGKLKKRGIV